MPFLTHSESGLQHNNYVSFRMISRDELDKIIPVKPAVVNKIINPRAERIRVS
jgi:hypothetical protein